MNTSSPDNFKIRAAAPEDAEFLADTVMGALGEELCIGLAEGSDNLPTVKKLFTNLAALDNSQYSYVNSFIAEDDKGNRAGAVIAYDGAKLHNLRTAFINEAVKLLGWNVSAEDVENWGDEASPDEVYIDSIFVSPRYRKTGIASALIKHVEKEYKSTGKPLGLLVESENKVARAVYESLGFKEVDISRFFSVPMIHMQK